MTWLLSIFSSAYTKLAAWGMALVGILAAVFMIRKSGADAERNKQTKRTLDNVEKAQKIRRNSPVDGAAERLRKSKFTRE